MCDPLYELLAFKVLSWGVPRASENVLLVVLTNVRLSLPSIVAGWASLEFVSPMQARAPRRHRSGIPGPKFTPSNPFDIPLHMSNSETRSWCSCSWYAVCPRTVPSVPRNIHRFAVYCTEVTEPTQLGCWEMKLFMVRCLGAVFRQTGSSISPAANQNGWNLKADK